MLASNVADARALLKAYTTKDLVPALVKMRMFMAQQKSAAALQPSGDESGDLGIGSQDDTLNDLSVDEEQPDVVAINEPAVGEAVEHEL